MSFPIRMLNGVGVVASRKRAIKSGAEFDSYFPKPSYSDPILAPNGENEMTIDKFVPNVVRTYQNDTSNIANYLKKSTLEGTLKAIFDFIYQNIQYKQDAPHEEQIRRPARSWADRKSGVDCDCYTVFISSILTNLNIPHYLRMSAYSSQRGFQHIYVIVPKTDKSNVNEKGTYFTIDPVLDKFNEEKPFLYKRDKGMGITKSLSGFPIRMLNGGASLLNPMVYQDIYYNPNMDTWALKGLDGGFYVEADINRRFVQPLYGVDSVGFIDTAIKVGGGLFKVGKGFLARRKARRAAKKEAKAQSNESENNLQNSESSLKSGRSSESSQVSAPNNDAVLSKIAASNKSSITSLQAVSSGINDKLAASNKATVMSLKAVDSGLKSQISNLTASFAPNISALLKNGASLNSVTSQLKSLAIKSLETSNSLQKEQINQQEQNKFLIDNAKVEQQKNDEFRNDTKTQTRIILIVIALVVVILIYLAVKNK